MTDPKLIAEYAKCTGRLKLSFSDKLFFYNVPHIFLLPIIIDAMHIFFYTSFLDDTFGLIVNSISIIIFTIVLFNKCNQLKFSTIEVNLPREDSFMMITKIFEYNFSEIYPVVANYDIIIIISADKKKRIYYPDNFLFQKSKQIIIVFDGKKVLINSISNIVTLLPWVSIAKNQNRRNIFCIQEEIKKEQKLSN